MVKEVIIETSLPVPMINILTDIVAYLGTDVSVDTLNKALKTAAEGTMKSIVDYNDDEIVSADIIDNPHSGIIDAPSTRVVTGRVVKVLVWYDNEFGYSRRLLDLASYMVNKG